ncbi:hypothetical protein V5739_13680 [Salinimicrobium sp. TIG7-5_MAKvit]|uniref:hypothetical protein n=1 Tax=Salinimicrobium sp. TIG7-5_MAKvit TaxID=3121289 RepID=UPI003C6DB7B5
MRLSLHPILQDKELERICEAIEIIVEHVHIWRRDYKYNPETNEFDPQIPEEDLQAKVAEYFSL